ncbi:MAG: hypothetical protein WCQ77_03910 [Planctomycetota bacterium]
MPWRKMATSRTVWCRCSQYAAMSDAFNDPTTPLDEHTAHDA